MQKTKRYFSLSIIFLVSFSCCIENANAALFYIAPDGVDSDDCSIASPCRTFSHVFSQMSAGDELILLDGTYSEANGTGYISYQGTNSAQAPSGIDRDNMTIVRAQNSGSVTIEGELFVGRSARKDSHIKFQGITFEGGGQLYNTDHIYVKDCGFHGMFGIGTNDHDQGNTYNLIEDSWIWAEGQRLVSANYRADNNIWRRIVIRGDGCNTANCTGSGNPTVGFTVYNSKNVSVQNVVNVDRILNGGSPYGDFATAQHDSDVSETPFENNEWLGCISINSEDVPFHMEADNSIAPSHYLKDNIALIENSESNKTGFNVGGDIDSIIENCTVISKNGSNHSMIRRYDNTVNPTTRNCIINGDAQYALVRGGTCSYMNIFGTFSEDFYYNTSCSTGEISSDPLANGSLLYPVRVEDGSVLDGTGYNGQDYGANVTKRYGAEGTFHGETGYNTLTDEDIWPWPNENRIKEDFATSSIRGFVGYTSPFGSPNTLTSYIWEYLGNEIPCDIYSTCDNNDTGDGSDNDSGDNNTNNTDNSSSSCFIGSIF